MTIQANEKKNKREPLLIDLNKLTDGEKVEMKKLGILSEKNEIVDSGQDRGVRSAPFPRLEQALAETQAFRIVDEDLGDQGDGERNVAHVGYPSAVIRATQARPRREGKP